MIRSGNPALRKKTFENLTTTSDEVMTLDGAVNKTAISMGILLLAAYYTYSNAIMDYVNCFLFQNHRNISMLHITNLCFRVISLWKTQFYFFHKE